jgi:hypothetical protein
VLFFVLSKNFLCFLRKESTKEKNILIYFFKTYIQHSSIIKEIAKSTKNRTALDDDEVIEWCIHRKKSCSSLPEFAIFTEGHLAEEIQKWQDDRTVPPIAHPALPTRT